MSDRVAEPNKYGDPGSGGRQVVPNPILFEAGKWRLYGHVDDEYSTMAHKCPMWGEANSSGNNEPEWRWYWGTQNACGNCDETAPDDIVAVYTLHNFDRIAKMKP